MAADRHSPIICWGGAHSHGVSPLLGTCDQWTLGRASRCLLSAPVCTRVRTDECPWCHHSATSHSRPLLVAVTHHGGTVVRPVKGITVIRLIQAITPTQAGHHLSSRHVLSLGHRTLGQASHCPRQCVPGFERASFEPHLFCVTRSTKQTYRHGLLKTDLL